MKILPSSTNLISFLTCITYFLLWQTIGERFKNALATLFHKLKVNKIQVVKFRKDKKKIGHITNVRCGF